MWMNAALMREVAAPLSLEAVQLDPPVASEVLVRLRATGVCHSDVHYWRGDIKRRLPLILGHEGAGDVVEVGPGVTSVKPGDRVVMTFLPMCGRCHECVDGRPLFCHVSSKLRDGTMPDGTRRLRDGAGNEIDNLLFISSFAEYAVVPEASVVPMTADMDWEHAALFGCGFTTGFAAATRDATLRVGAAVVVIGCGGVGLAAIAGAVSRGAATVVAVDANEAALDVATSVGATHTVRSTEPDEIVSTVLELTSGQGADWAFESVGGRAAPQTISAAYGSIRRGGTLSILGLAGQAIESVPISPMSLVTTGRTIKGVLFGNSNLKADMPAYLRLVESGRLDMSAFVGGVLPFAEVNRAIEAMHRGEQLGRTVLTFDSGA